MSKGDIQMKYIKKLFVTVLVILTLSLYLPKMALSQQQFASADVPKHEPQSWGTPEKDIPTIKQKKTSRWIWVILVALIGGVAAAAGGGDSGGGGGTSTATTTDNPTTDGGTGNYTGTW